MISKGSASAAITMNSAIPLFSVLVAAKWERRGVNTVLSRDHISTRVDKSGNLHKQWLCWDVKLSRKQWHVKNKIIHIRQIWGGDILGIRLEMKGREQVQNLIRPVQQSFSFPTSLETGYRSQLIWILLPKHYYFLCIGAMDNIEKSLNAMLISQLVTFYSQPPPYLEARSFFFGWSGEVVGIRQCGTSRQWFSTKLLWH